MNGSSGRSLTVPDVARSETGHSLGGKTGGHLPSPPACDAFRLI